MENKSVGYLLLGISIVIIFVIFMFQSALQEIVLTSCGEEHATVCPMNQTIDSQTNLALGIVAILIVVSLVLVFSKPHEKVIVQTKTIHKKKPKKKINTADLKSEEKKVLEIIQKNKTIFQADLIEKSGLGKVKISRILDRLENRDIIEKKRRGMTNVIVLKD